MAMFDQTLTQDAIDFLLEDGFADGRTRAVGCMGWIWGKWLQSTAPDEIRHKIESFVERGMEMQSLSNRFLMRPEHDLYLLHCAIFACDNATLVKVAERLVDASGFKKYKPHNNGELYACAWVGMLKYWILGDARKSDQERAAIWLANRDISFTAAGKPLVEAWGKGDWKSFIKHQKQDFTKLWERAQKNKAAVAGRGGWVVNMDRLSFVQRVWCWAHCGLALLAYRRGIEVATDPLWLPPHALTCNGMFR